MRKSAAVPALVFVYGSLKHGLEHHAQMDGARCLGAARAPGYRLVLYEESYPALTEARGAREAVLGELYQVSSEHLARLDAFEDVPQLYQRTLISLEDGRRAWAYVIAPTLASRYPTLRGAWTGRPGSQAR